MSRRLLVLNAGSSSLKYAVYKSFEGEVTSTLASGMVSNIGERQQKVVHTNIVSNKNEKIETIEREIGCHKAALLKAVSLISNDSNGEDEITAVGHRVVHGGEKLTEAKIIDSNVINAIRQAIPLAPLHNPHNLHAIETAINVMSASVQQVAVFDTAFHATLPQHAYLYGVPYHLYKDYGIRKYGFHGTSHEYILLESSKYLNRPVESLNIISCHLGAGASICCIKNGVSIDTSMGMTPLEGLIMATRCGDVDLNVVFYMMEQLDITAEECKDILQNKSGWFGICGEKDAIAVENSSQEGNELAQVAVDAVVHRIQKYIGAYYWYLQGRVDAIVFTAGLGENWSKLRELCMENADMFGFSIDVQKNNRKQNGRPFEVSSDESTKKILVIPTNEELNIAQKTLKLIQ